MSYLPYAGIGSRETPTAALELMRRIAAGLAKHGFTLRSGGADGADTAFERGAGNGPKEIYLPWANFNGRQNGIVPFETEALRTKAEELASKAHPNWGACKQGARNMHTRNVAQVLGSKLVEPSLFIVCWTRGGSGAGGTGQALRIAKAWHIPIFDLGSPDFDIMSLSMYAESLRYPEITDPQ